MGKKNWTYLALVGIGSWLLWELADKKLTPRLAGLGADSGDISSEEDLARAAANLAALEQHIESAAATSGDVKYLNALTKCRNMRRAAMGKLMPMNAGGESFCMAKHCLLASSQLSEAAAKRLAEGDKETAMQLLRDGKSARDMALALAKAAQPGHQCAVCRNG
jgi:hypothetical protein